MFLVFKKNLYLVILISIIGCSSNKNMIQYNGIYQSSKIDNNYYDYLRFYKNNTVIQVSSTGKPKHLKKWFTNNHKSISSGNYFFKNDSLFFETKSENGIVIYKGKFENKILVLKHLSKINGHKDSLFYSFKKINF